MARFSRLHPVKSYKHVVDLQGALAAGGNSTDFVIADAVDAPVLASPAQVQVASTVSSIYLNVQAAVDSSGALPNFYMYVYKNPGNNLTMPGANVVGVDDNKRWVIHQEMKMFEETTNGIARTMFAGVIKVPPRLRRMGQDDIIAVRLTTPGVAVQFCCQAIYKEFR